MKTLTIEQKRAALRKEMVFTFGTRQTMESIAAWVDFIETGKITSEILLSAAEHLRKEELRELQGIEIPKQLLVDLNQGL